MIKQNFKNVPLDRSEPVSLVIAAHGSPDDSVNKQILRFISRIREKWTHGEVFGAIHHGNPDFSNFLNQISANKVIVIPLMTSEGFFFRKLQQSIEASNFEGEVVLSRPIGCFDSSSQFVCDHFHQILKQHDSKEFGRDLLVVGHGSKKNNHSRLATWRLVKFLRSQHESQFDSFRVAFIDDSPTLQEVISNLQHNKFANTKQLLVFPFLITSGNHFKQDIPNALAVDPGRISEAAIFDDEELETKLNYQTIRLLSPFGEMENLDKHIVDIAYELLGTHFSPVQNRFSRNLPFFEKETTYGTVHLVGAGIGDEELITCKGKKLLESADVVLHDRLISPVLLTYLKETASVIDVGKLPKRHKVPQNEICRLLVEYARKGKTVVRLKGGDPFLFGRGGEELEYCKRHKIPCKIVPGVSSSLSAPLAAGISVTSRGIASSVRISTGEAGTELPAASINPLVSSSDDWETEVVLMGRRNLSKVVRRLMDQGRPPTTPCCCIENAFCPNQRIISGNLANICKVADESALKSPMTFVAGDVVSKTEGVFAKEENIERRIEIERPSREQARLGKNALSVAVVYPRSESGELVKNLYRSGFDVQCLPLTRIEEPIADQEWLSEFLKLAKGGKPSILVDSEHSIAFLQNVMKQLKLGWRLFDQIFCTDSEVEESLRDIGIQPDGVLKPGTSSLQTMTDFLSKRYGSAGRLYLPADRHDLVRSISSNSKLETRTFPIRREVVVSKNSVSEPSIREKVDAALFYSRLSVELWCKWNFSRDIVAICNDPQTERVARSLGFRNVQLSPANEVVPIWPSPVLESA